MASYVKSKDSPSFCLPKKYISTFLAKVGDGTLDPATLAQKTSAERRQLFSDTLGPENAREVNALFEEKLLLKN